MREHAHTREYTYTQTRTHSESYTHNRQKNCGRKWISDLENKVVEMTATEQYNEKRMKSIVDSLRDLWDKIKCTNI